MTQTWDFKVKSGSPWEYNDAFVTYDDLEEVRIKENNPVYYEKQGTETVWTYQNLS